MGYFERRRTKKAEKAARKEQAQREKEELLRQQYEDTVQQRVHDLGISRELAVYLVDLEMKVEFLLEHRHSVNVGGSSGVSGPPRHPPT
jgi:hypothetical protein